jgi:AcrR family transcriptional regulator
MSDDVREDILMAAAGLFVRHGYTATSTRLIAAEVGLRQASLFHYFERKEDLLTELLDRTVRPALEVARRHGLERRDAASALWLLTREDVANLCRWPHNLGALQLLPEVKSGPQFAWFWRRRNQLFRVYGRIIARGCASGAFPEVDPQRSVDVVFGLVESVVTASPAFRRRVTTPVVIADAVLRVCGVAPAQARRVARGVHPLDG